MLRDGAARALEEYVDDPDSVRATLTALRDGYCGELATEAALAAALEAEENGEVPLPLYSLLLTRCCVLWVDVHHVGKSTG